MSYLPKLGPAIGNGLGGLPEKGLTANRGDMIFIDPGTYTFTVPANVFSLSVVCIGAAAQAASDLGPGNPGGNSSFGSFVTAGGSNGTTGGSGSTIGGNIGGGNGGNGSGVGSSGGSGGGGTGGYSGNGGNGNGDTVSTATDGQGGGGAGGSTGAYGGGTTINGQGASGVAGASAVNRIGSYSVAGVLPQKAFGAGGPGASASAAGGGGLRWANNISVSPGSQITVIVGEGGVGGASGRPQGNSGAVRVIWGTGRSFPFNAA